MTEPFWCPPSVRHRVRIDPPMTLKPVAAAVLVSTLAAHLHAQSGPADWPQWRGPNRDGVISSFTEPKSWPEKLTRKWKVDVGLGYATPVVIGNRVYMFARQGDEEVLGALDADTGKVLWRTTYPAAFTISPAAALGHLGDASGAAAMPSATAVCPDAIPTATASANSSATSPRSTRARRRGRTTGARPASRARSSSPRRRAPRRPGSSRAPRSRRTRRRSAARAAPARRPGTAPRTRAGSSPRTRRCSCPSTPRASRSAIVRESSCSTGR